MVRLLLHANPMLWPLACVRLSRWVCDGAFAALRRERVIPREFVERFLERLSSGKLDRERALELCRATIARRRGSSRWWSTRGASPARDPPDLQFRRRGRGRRAQAESPGPERLSTLGPLLGLLGTVVGIIQSFDALGGRVGPARGEALAQGISLALVATAFGLAIAIVSVAFYYFFLNRVDVLVRELDRCARGRSSSWSRPNHKACPDGSPPRFARPTVDPHRQESRIL